MKRLHPIPAKALTSISVACLLFALNAPKAHAFSDAAAIKAAQIAITQTIKDGITKSIQNYVKSQTSALKDYFEDLSTQLSANDGQALKNQATQNDVKDARTVMLASQKENIDARNDATSGASLCNNITGAASTQGLEEGVHKWRSNAVQNVLAYDSGHIPGHKELATPNTLDTLYNNSHCADSASSYDVQIGRCKKESTSKIENVSLMKDGTVGASDDQNADLLLNDNDLSKAQQRALGRLVYLIADSNPIGQPVPASSNMSEDDKAKLVRIDALRAKKSVAISALMGLAAQKTTIEGAGNSAFQEKATAWANATAAQVAGYTKHCLDGKCDYFPSGITEYNADELRAKYWYWNLTYGIFASAEGKAPSQKDANEIAAFNMAMTFKQYKLLREIDASLATIASIMIDNEQARVVQ